MPPPMKKTKKAGKKLVLSTITLQRVSGGTTNSDLYCTVLGMCQTQPPVCPSNWITHCPVNTDTGFTCIVNHCLIG